MQQENMTFELKAQARRLRTALAEMNMEVTHTAALNLIARAQGNRNWESLEAKVATECVNEAAQVQAQAQAQTARHVYLTWLEACVYLANADLEQLDDCVYEVLGAEQASSTNNQGVYSQLDALLSYQEETAKSPDAAQKHLLEWLTEAEVLPACRFSLPVRVSVCAGSRFSREKTVDGLAWFACQSFDTLEDLVDEGLSNNELTDEVGLWLAQHSPDNAERAELSSMLDYMRNTCEAYPDVVGITVSVDRDALEAYCRGTILLSEDQKNVLCDLLKQYYF